MFGYVKAYTPELRMREHEFYRAVYCGLCKSMKKLTGAASTFTLSYDMVFLALCRMAVTGDRYEVTVERCGMNPFRRKKRATMSDGEELRYAASVSALLSYHKLSDDKNDEKGIKRLCASLLLPGAERRLRRASLPRELADAVEEELMALCELENKRLPSVDGGADIFGRLLGRIFAHGIEGDGARILFEVGKGVGRFIYVIDAADDADEDAESGRYNPLLALWESGEKGALSESAKSAVSDALRLHLKPAAAAAELITVPDGGYPETLAILKNILYLGMPKEAERVLDGSRKRVKN